MKLPFLSMCIIEGARMPQSVKRRIQFRLKLDIGQMARPIVDPDIVVLIDGQPVTPPIFHLLGKVVVSPDQT